MKNKKYITPNEINKFVYCPYQWYYEVKYGRKKITDLYKEKNKLLGLSNKTLSNFKKGQDFHDKYARKHEKIDPKIIILIFLFVIFIIFILTNL